MNINDELLLQIEDINKSKAVIKEAKKWIRTHKSWSKNWAEFNDEYAGYSLMNAKADFKDFCHNTTASLNKHKEEYLAFCKEKNVFQTEIPDELIGAVAIISCITLMKAMQSPFDD